MGLDMYLKEVRYLSHWDHNKGTEEYAAAEQVLAAANLTARVDGGVIVSAPVMYWRKANMIHNWFVTNCQDGRDECQQTDIDTEQLEKLVEVCEQVLADHSKADALLPPQSGFFFGSTDIDEWYWSDLRETVTGLRTAIDGRSEGAWFTYQASW